MFGFSKKKTQVQEHIDQDGIEHATTRFSEIISQDLTTRELAYQFILEEVEAASQGNKVAMKFASESGILSSEYEGAMRKSCPEIDKPQQLLLGLSLQLKDNFNLMVEFRIKIDDKIMKKFCLGKYEKKDDRINRLMQLLKAILEDDAAVLPVLDSSIPVPANARAYRYHIVNVEKHIKSAKDIILEISKLTGKDSKFIIKQSLSII